MRPTAMPLRRDALGLLGWLVLSFAAAGVGSAASVNSGAFYAELSRPVWAPPGWLFGPVWTALYTLMGVAAWLVWREDRKRGRAAALSLNVAQLVANALWTWIFFEWKSGLWAFAEILLLLALLVATVAAFWRVRRLAGALMAPYLLWVAFASCLTWAVWQANPTVL